MINIKQLNIDYDEVHTKMFSIFELKKKYTTKVLFNIEKKEYSFLTFDKQLDDSIEINLRNMYNAETVCGIMEDEINEPLEHFEKNLKEFREAWLKRKLNEEKEITEKGFTQIDYIKIGYKLYPRINIVKSTGVIDFGSSEAIKCSWDKPIEKVTADKLMRLRKKDLVLTDGNVNFICHNVIKVDLTTNKTPTGTNVCFGMTIEFKKGEKLKSE